MATSFPGSLSYPSRSPPCSSHFSFFFWADSAIILQANFARFTTHALLPIFPEGVQGARVNPDTSRIRAGRGKFDLNTDTCGRGNLWIRWEKLADSKISGYVQSVLKAWCMYVSRNNSKTISYLTPFAQFITSNVKIQNHIVNWDES